MRFQRFLSLFVVVSLASRPNAQEIEVAGELFVDLRASELEAGADRWFNNGTIGDFVLAGLPSVTHRRDRCRQSAVTFTARTSFSLLTTSTCSPRLVGPDPTRSIEVWAYNP